MQGYICGPNEYDFDGWAFEFRSYGGAWPLDVDGEPLAYAGQDFWNMIRRFCALPEAERETYRRGGGCRELRSAEA